MIKAIAILPLLACGLQSQHILYNQKLDKTAQDAAIAAKDITSGALFDTMVRNVDAQAKQEAETTLAYTKEQMRAKLSAFDVWSSPADRPDTVVNNRLIHTALCHSPKCFLEVLEKRLQAGTLFDSPTDDKQAQARLAEITKKSADLKAAVKALEAAAKNQTPAVVELLSHLGDAQDLVKSAHDIQALTGNAGLGNALTEISSGLDQMILLYNIVKGIWEGYEAVNVDAISLRPPPEVIELRLLALEQEHIKNLTQIRANMHLEAGDALQRIDEARSTLQRAGVWDSTDSIEHTLRVAALGDPTATPAGANPKQLRQLLDALLQSAAAVASEDAAVKLASNRESDEARRYAIRRSAVNSSSYDQTIQAAVQRLALYYKSGIKPSELAQILFYITNTIAVPTIAAK